MKLYFARHAESVVNLTRTFSNHALPHGLTSEGVTQARNLALRLRSLSVDELWSSPIPRATETAGIVAAELKLDLRSTQALREFDVGRFEGTDSEEGWREHTSVMLQWLNGNHECRVGGGESLSEIVLRLRRFILSLLDEGAGLNVALIAHGGLYRMALPHILDNLSPDFAFTNLLGNGQLISAEANNGRLTCLDWAGLAPQGTMRTS